MIDKSEKTEAPRQAMQPSLPTRLSYGKVVEDIDKWTSSAGLQRPK
jgi:hypothetical protein